MVEWTMEDVAARFSEAAETGRRLPSVRVQGYFNVWPAFKREPWEVMGSPEDGYRPLPPSPEVVERMLEAMHWVQWLEEEHRHLIWMRAKRYEWRKIARRFGCDRTTAWRRWQKALQIVVDHLNGHQIGVAGHSFKLEGQVEQCMP